MADELGVRVVVVEPRRVACRSLARFLAGQRGEPVGESIGYAVRFDSRFDPDATEIVFVTPGIARQWFIAGKLDGAAVLIDEFHERTLDNDLLTAALLADASRCGQLIFTSATVDGDALANAIGANLIHSEGRTFPVAVDYIGDAAVPSERDLEQRIADALRALRSAGEAGGVLVFLPSWKTIRSVHEHLDATHGERLEIYDVHGSMPMTEIERAFASSSTNSPVFLATNVAETSLTIPGIRAVIDSGLVKQKLHRAGRSALVTVPTSLASMEQRAGRAGRVAAGRCVRVFARRFRPQRFTTPEIEREPLDDLVFAAAQMGFEGEGFDRLRWVTRPPSHALDGARRRLRECGILDAEGRRTARG